VSSLPSAFWASTRQSDHLSPGASLECSMAPRVIFAVCPHTAKRLWFLCRASTRSKDSYVYFFTLFPFLTAIRIQIYTNMYKDQHLWHNIDIIQFI
jgi:hypothetical protein